jgi:RimJ/RimL family protein N-acetyltransferase
MKQSDLFREQIGLRAATESDCRKFWELRNESAARAASFDSSVISYETHQIWFAKRLADPNTKLFVVLHGKGEEIGYVRFEIAGSEAEISVSLDKEFRGKGLGAAAIRAGCEHVMRELKVERIIAHVRCDNPASAAAFKKVGFVVRAEVEIKGVKAYMMSMQPNRSVSCLLSRS